MNPEPWPFSEAPGPAALVTGSVQERHSKPHMDLPLDTAGMSPGFWDLCASDQPPTNRQPDTE